MEQMMDNLRPEHAKGIEAGVDTHIVLDADWRGVARRRGASEDSKTEVVDQDNHVLANRAAAHGHGKFAFSTDKETRYEICFVSRVPPGHTGLVHEITVRSKHGVEAKSYEGVAEAAKLKPLEMQLKKLEDLSEAIVQDFAYMREREEQMRDTNESTSSRVLYFSVFGLCCLLSLATWQVLYLRRYFKAKKLIE